MTTASDRRKHMKYATLAIHGGEKDDSGKFGVNYPIYPDSTFIQPEIGKFRDFCYSRGSNPTRNAVERLAADLEGARYGIATASGMAATSLVFGLLESGDKLLINSNVYGGTWRFVSNIFKNRGISYEIVKDLNSYDFSKAEKSVRAVFIETPSNPLLEITDIKKVADAAHKKGILVIVDNTFMTSYFQKPLALGADIVEYSATKYYAGHSDILAGLVITDNDELYEKLRFLNNTFGGILSPTDAFLLNRGIKTLPLRMEKHQQNALAIAEYLEKSPAVRAVFYPGLKSSRNYKIQKKQASGNGGVLSLRLSPSYDSGRFVQNLKLFALAVSLGGVESLICHPASMTHESYSPELQKQIGIDKTLLRMSAGIEDSDDLIKDIEQALKKAKKRG